MGLHKKGSEKKAAFKDFLKERRICLQVKFMWFRLQNMLEHVSSLTDCNLNMYAIYWMQSVNITVFFSMIIVLCLYIYISKYINIPTCLCMPAYVDVLCMHFLLF